MTGREQLTAHLRGSGLELGSRPPTLRAPDAGVGALLDRWRPEQNRELYPELGTDASFPTIEVIADFDVDRLDAIADESVDFVICSHVLEHLADPIGFLGEIHRVLRPGALALVLLPDRRLTFDRDRADDGRPPRGRVRRGNHGRGDDDHDRRVPRALTARRRRSPRARRRLSTVTTFFDLAPSPLDPRALLVGATRFDPVLDYCAATNFDQPVGDRRPTAGRAGRASSSATRCEGSATCRAVADALVRADAAG